MSDVVNYEVQGKVALITLNRPEARNAVNGDVAQGLEAAINQMCLSVGTDGWAINLDWWNAYKSGAYEAYVGMARVAMNAVRDHHGQPVI